MKLLKTISNNDLNLPVEVEKDSKVHLREAARAVVLDDKYNIAILFVSKQDYHKLPGGGLEEDESISQALDREILEETGCHIKVMSEIGEIEEHRENYLLTQKSYCFSAKLMGEKGKPGFMDDEIEDGFVLKWVELKTAIELLKQDKPKDYQGHFIQVRDLKFLQEFAKQIDFNG